MRDLRLRVARGKGRHKKWEWEELCNEFGNRCVRCGIKGKALEKDHIIPIYQGGSDLITNIQPLCKECNTSKGPESFNWAERRRTRGFES